MIPRCVVNPSTSEPPGLEMMVAHADLAWTFHRGFRQYAPTPLHQLDALAAELGIGSLHLKDESQRFGLNAFKGLGPSFAMHHWVATHETTPDMIFTTATDGNHGRAVAWMARQLGYRAVIYMPDYSAPARVEAIINEGARVVLVPEGYDAAVQLARTAGDQHGWIVIQDTATPGYTEVPSWIAAGYWTMARELESTLHRPAQPAVDLVLVHAGVGTWPAAMVEYYWHRYGLNRPRIVIVEPVEAACVVESIVAGHPTSASGSLRTIMAGLNCGYPSITAFETLRRGADGFITISDDWAERAMRRLASNDPPIVSGESGSASVAGLMAMMQDPAYAELRAHVGLGGTSRVLVWSTEGATDPAGWERVAGHAPSQELSRPDMRQVTNDR